MVAHFKTAVQTSASPYSFAVFFLLAMDLLLKSDCPISIFSGLGGHGLSFFILGQ